jgi:ABC-2 type transport system ATP-binding protein
MSAIQIENVTKVYKKRIRALNDISFKVREGMITGFIGRNGSGKTTTINILAGLLKPDTGTVRIMDETIKPGDWRYKARTGFMLEKLTLVENLTGREYLSFAGNMYGINKKDTDQRIDKFLEYVDMENGENKPIKTYSHGMKKKISLVTALLNNPDLVILDEPLAGIDPVSGSSIKQLIRTLKEKKKTIFFSSHELGVVENLCDDIIIIENGVCVFAGTMDELKTMEGTANEGIERSTLEEIYLKLIGNDPSSNDLTWL